MVYDVMSTNELSFMGVSFKFSYRRIVKNVIGDCRCSNITDFLLGRTDFSVNEYNQRIRFFRNSLF